MKVGEWTSLGDRPGLVVALDGGGSRASVKPLGGGANKWRALSDLEPLFGSDGAPPKQTLAVGDWVRTNSGDVAQVHRFAPDNPFRVNLYLGATRILRPNNIIGPVTGGYAMETDGQRTLFVWRGTQEVTAGAADAPVLPLLGRAPVTPDSYATAKPTPMRLTPGSAGPAAPPQRQPSFSTTPTAAAEDLRPPPGRLKSLIHGDDAEAAAGRATAEGPPHEGLPSPWRLQRRMSKEAEDARLVNLINTQANLMLELSSPWVRLRDSRENVSRTPSPLEITGEIEETPSPVSSTNRKDKTKKRCCMQ